jgi:hypothetical protein
MKIFDANEGRIHCTSVTASQQQQATAAAPQVVYWLCAALQCLKYKTDQQVDVKKMEKLNSLFFVLMARGEHPTGGLCYGSTMTVSSSGGKGIILPTACRTATQQTHHWCCKSYNPLPL